MFRKEKIIHHCNAPSGYSYSPHPSITTDTYIEYGVPKYEIREFLDDEIGSIGILLMNANELCLSNTTTKFCSYKDAMSFFIEYDLINKKYDLRIVEVK